MITVPTSCRCTGSVSFLAHCRRYGRNSELPGEDPFHTGSYGVAFVTAMQTPDANGHPRVNTYLKHFDAYATETNRMHSVSTYITDLSLHVPCTSALQRPFRCLKEGRCLQDNNITQFDFWDSYLPQYKMVFTEAKAAGAMCSYQAGGAPPKSHTHRHRHRHRHTRTHSHTDTHLPSCFAAGRLICSPALQRMARRPARTPGY